MVSLASLAQSNKLILTLSSSTPLPPFFTGFTGFFLAGGFLTAGLPGLPPFIFTSTNYSSSFLGAYLVVLKVSIVSLFALRIVDSSGKGQYSSEFLKMSSLSYSKTLNFLLICFSSELLKNSSNFIQQNPNNCYTYLI